MGVDKANGELGSQDPKTAQNARKGRENRKTKQDLNWPHLRDWPQIGQNKTIDKEKNQKTREDCGCPKFLARKVFLQLSLLLQNSSLIFRQHEMLFLPRFGQGKWLLEDRPRLRERSWIFSSETATASLSCSEKKPPKGRLWVLSTCHD